MRDQSKLQFETLESRRLLSVTTAIQSGAWDSPGTWDAGVPNNSLRAIILAGTTVTLTGTDHVAREIVVQGTLNVAEAENADFDGDGLITGSDFLRHQRGLGTLDAKRADGDADGDLDVDSQDLNIWKAHYAAGAPQTTKTLSSDWIHVNSGGVFQIGSEQNRYDANDFVLTLTGEDPNASFNVEGAGNIADNNAFLMAAGGGRLQFFGKEKLTFTKLAATAEIGAKQILVEEEIDRDFDGDTDADDGSLNWEVGDQIVVASSSRDYNDEEVRTITAIADQGDGTFLITIDAALLNRHYGEIETYGNGTRTWDIDMRAEVAALNRNVKIQGLASHDTDNVFGDRARFNAGTGDGFAGHTMIMASAGQITIDSVQFDRMGQTGRLGRYPLHWHVAGDRAGDILRGASVTNSNNRGMTVHGTHNLLIEDVVLHDVHGHGFFMEDGVETGNQYIANIALGIHKVGSFGPDGPNEPNLNDPFIVDTHDHVGQNKDRFLSSAAFWITSPDNTWVGNVAAGSEGTGFWFIFPRSPIGAAAGDPQYNGVNANETNLRQFDHNTAHSSHAGLNFDRGKDIEVPVGATLDPAFEGLRYAPPQEPQVNYFTGYKTHVALYHRGDIGNFHENRYADNFDSTFITFTQRITDTLYVGHSRGNSDPSEIVTGHSLYDGANTMDGTHFAGYAAGNAHMFRSHGGAQRHTHHVLSNTSFEDDGSADHVSISNRTGGSAHNSPFSFGSGALYDADGTLTGAVGGGAGYTVVTNHPFHYDSGDFLPAGWNAWVSDELFAMVHVTPANSNADFQFTAPDGDTGIEDGNSFNIFAKMDAGDYVVNFPEGVNSVANGFEIKYYVRVGPDQGSTVFGFEGLGGVLAPTGVPQVGSVATLRNASGTSYAVEGNDLWVKFFSSANDVAFSTAPASTVVLWEDTSPPDNTDGAAVTKIADPFGTGMGDIGQWVTNGRNQFHNVNAAGPAIDVSSYHGMDYVFSFDYYIDSTQPLTDDRFYQNVYGATNFADISGGAALDSWTRHTTTGTIDTSGSTTVNPLIIVNHMGTTETTPSFYIDNISFLINLPAGSSAAATSDSSASLAVASSKESLFSAGGDLSGIALYSEFLGDLDAEDTPPVDLEPARLDGPRDIRNSEHDAALTTLDYGKVEVSEPSDFDEDEPEWLVDDLQDAVFSWRSI